MGYEYFGSLLQCSMQGNSAYPAYSGDASQYEVHKFMNLDPNEVGYFITQVAQLQSICQAEECPIAPNSTCDGVPESVEPAKAGGDNATATATMSGTAGMPTSTTPVVVGNGASAVSMSLLAVFGGLAALCL